MSGYIGTQPVPQATQTRDAFTATAGQTSFATAGYTPSYLDVFLNGVHLQNGTDYTAANGSDVVLTVGAALGDVLEVVAYSTFDSANTYNRSEADAEFVSDPDGVITVSSGNVGIGTSSPDSTPSTKLHIREDDSTDYRARAVVQASDQRLVLGSHWQAGVAQYSYVQATNDAETGAQNLLLNPDGGAVTMPNQPSFKVAANYGSPPYINGATLLYTAVEYDVGNNFANSRFTAPVAGVYHFDVSLMVTTVSSGSGFSYIALTKNGNVTAPYSHSDSANITSYDTLTLSRTIQLAANDYVQVYVYNHISHRVYQGPNYNHFSGHLIG